MMTPARKCSATKIDSRPCRAWAVRDSDPPLCNRHRDQPAAGKRLNVAGTAPGPVFDAPPKEAFFDSSEESSEESSEGSSVETVEESSRESLVESSVETVEEARARATLDFYSRSFSLDEVAALVNIALAGSLNGEVAATRVAIRRALQQLEDELSPFEYTQLAGLIFTGASTIARLMRSQRSLSGEAAAGIIGALAKGLDEISTEWRVDL